MSVFLSPVGGAGAQFFDNNGNPLTGGKLYTYAAGTTTPQATYTSATGSTFHTNPIVLDAAGRVPGSSEIWLADNQIYKFVLKDSNDVLLATWDQITGVNSNFVNYTTETEVQTATAGQTVFTLTTMSYQPGTGNLTVYVDGVNQYEGDSYVETDSTTVTFTAGLHVGAQVKFTTAVQTTGNATDASVVSYTAPYTGAVPYTVEDKLAQTVSVKDFGAVGDGVTDDTAAIQAAINATPSGGILIFPDSGTFLLDTLTTVKVVSDLGSNYLYGALIIDKPIRIVGNTGAKLKLKPFSTAWAAQDLGDTICTVIVNSSNVHIDGLNIDANGDNHYITYSGYKYWENLVGVPNSKRTPGCYAIIAAPTQANVENVLIENCVLEHGLFGVYFFGNAVDTSRQAFLDGTLATGVVKNSMSRNNTIKFGRGNAILFNIGADNCVSNTDTFLNNMYHSARVYSRAVNCKVVNGRSHVNCDEIIARYNSTDNGYWRTDDSSSANFKIIRSGFHIGGQDSYSATYGYSVVNCGFVNCEHVFVRPTVATYTDYFTPSSLYMAAYSSTGLPSCYIEGCHSNGADYGIVFYYDSIAPADALGLRAQNNSIYSSFVSDIYSQGIVNATIKNNYIFVNPTVTYFSAHLIDYVNGSFTENTFSGSPTAATYAVAIQNSATNVSLKNNVFGSNFILARQYVQIAGSTPFAIYPKRIANLIGSNTIGSASLSNSWAVAYSPASEGQENIICVMADNTIEIFLRLTGASATANTVATLVAALRPTQPIGFVATDVGTGGSYPGRILTDGRIQINLPAFPSATLTQLYANVAYSVLL